MTKKKYKYQNTITLVNRKVSQTWTLPEELLDEILNNYIDDFIYSKFNNDPHFRVKVCSKEVGIIWNVNVTANFYHALRRYLKQKDLIYVERID